MIKAMRHRAMALLSIVSVFLCGLTAALWLLRLEPLPEDELPVYAKAFCFNVGLSRESSAFGYGDSNALVVSYYRPLTAPKVASRQRDSDIDIRVVRWSRVYATAGTRANAPSRGPKVVFGCSYGVTFPLWTIALLATFPCWKVLAKLRRAVASWSGDLSSRRAKRFGRCRVCGYDLRATPNRCPECGAIPVASPVPSPGTPGEG